MFPSWVLMFLTWKHKSLTWVHMFLSWKHKIRRHEKTNPCPCTEKSIKRLFDLPPPSSVNLYGRFSHEIGPKVWLSQGKAVTLSQIELIY